MGRLRPNVLWLGILAFLAGCSTDTPRLAEAAEAAGMNVLVVTVDTLRADHLGCYGHPDAQTPTIDALARDGLRFERATTVSPITLPSHASMFTGLGAPNHGVRQRWHWDPLLAHVDLPAISDMRKYTPQTCF